MEDNNFNLSKVSNDISDELLNLSLAASMIVVNHFVKLLTNTAVISALLSFRVSLDGFFTLAGKGHSTDINRILSVLLQISDLAKADKIFGLLKSINKNINLLLSKHSTITNKCHTSNNNAFNSINFTLQTSSEVKSGYFFD